MTPAGAGAAGGGSMRQMGWAVLMIGAFGGCDAGEGRDSDTGAVSDTEDTVDTSSGDVCERWTAARADLSEGTWSGDTATCDAGALSDDARATALRLVNLYRALAGLPAVGEDAAKSAAAQECALMMHVNGQLNHFPPSSWTCYSADGASAAGQSNIASGPTVMAIDMYMSDFGNDTTLGHRRWILSNWLGDIGIGGTSNASCLQVIGGAGSGTNTWTSWPPPGEVPLELMYLSYVPVDQTGWTVQSDTISLGGALVTVRKGGDVLPVTVERLLSNYGSSDAIRFVADGWTTSAGTYQVEITGISSPISWETTFVSCGG